MIGGITVGVLGFDSANGFVPRRELQLSTVSRVIDEQTGEGSTLVEIELSRFVLSFSRVQSFPTL